MKHLLYFLSVVMVAAGCSPRIAPVNPSAPGVPLSPEEFRGVWVATVANIDWPSRPGLTAHEQKREFRAILDRAVSLNFNAVIFQVRPAADALYESDIEPWSEYLSGVMGAPPEPYYDPLQFAIEESHRRGLELHAWFNPFRARHPTGVSPISHDHVSISKPDAVVSYGDYLWLDPGNPVAQAHSMSVILDVVRRYDIDGVHMDDYFYPYQIHDSSGVLVPFLDTGSYGLWLADNDSIALNDWRRLNIDNFVEQLYNGIKKTKPHVKFGISPFGIWRPGHPPQIEGYDAYDKLYADSRKWLKEGWVDYFTPQLYWKIDVAEQSYPALLDWWVSQNDKGRHIWPGNFTSRVFLEGNRRWDPEEIINQIAVTREKPGSTGNVHFSMKALFNNDTGMAHSLGDGPYREAALVPGSPWLSKESPPKPQILVEDIGTGVLCTFGPGNFGSDLSRWVVWRRNGNQWYLELVPGWKSAILIDESDDTNALVVAAVNRAGEMGPFAVVNLDR